MAPANKALLQIHLCVVIWGFTAILGKLITLPAFALVWWRMLFVVAALALLPAFWRGVRSLDVRTLATFAGIGVVVAVHWVTFYGAIKLANASVAATCMGVAPILVIFGAIYHWYPKITGRLLHEGLGKFHFWVTFVGAYAIFLPLHYIGLMGVPRRYYHLGEMDFVPP